MLYKLVLFFILLFVFDILLQINCPTQLNLVGQFFALLLVSHEGLIVELQGFEPWSGGGMVKLSTRLVKR